MQKQRYFFFFILMLSFFSSHTAMAKEYKTIEWTDLMPEKDLQALLNPPAYIDEIEDGSEADQMIGQSLVMTPKANDPYQQALVSKDIIPQMQGQLIRLPGFVVPLTFGENEFDVTQFFFVPFFGACIHMPPPPPNQIIFVDYPRSLKLTSLHDAFWISGKLKTSLTENETATSAYSLELHSIKPYYE